MPTWIARDELGRIIDVTADSVADVPPPGPEEIAAGNGAAAAGAVVVSETEPVDPSAEDIWVRTYTESDPTLSAPPPYPVHVWDGAQWLETGIAHIDGAGVLRGIVQFLDNGLSIFTYDDTGTRRVEITGFDTGFDMWMNDANGVLRTLLNVNGGNSPAVEMQARDALGATLAGLTVSGEGVEMQMSAGAHMIVVNGSGVAVTTTGTFTYNGDEVAVVP